MRIRKMVHSFARKPRTVRVFTIILSLMVGFIFTPAVGAFAQETDGNNLSTVLKQDLTKRDGLTEVLNEKSRGFWEYIDLLRSSASGERPEEAGKIQTFSLYPQSFSAAKPEAYQTAPARSFLFAVPDRGKENAFLGLANVGSNGDEKMEPKSVQQSAMSTELLLGYQWGNFGSILFGRAIQYERLGDDIGRVNDMGWRIKFMKTF